MGASPPALVADLVDRFSRDRKVFQSLDYKEEQLRAEFLNPLFESLGWDVSNKAGLTEVFKPVIHEESIKVAGATKAPPDGSPLTAHGLPLSDADSGPSAVSRKPIADSDRGIEHYAFLQSLMNGERIYPRLVKHFRDAADGSQLTAYSPRPSDSGPSAVSRWLLALIIGSLYYPDCPYEFSVLPADILGQVYEQFLGKVIRLTTGHQAKVEEKPEVRKAGGLRTSSLQPASDGGQILAA
ncbi:hypothetical protein FJY68_07105 [candidate division WOR-3 bacterium]|uniref:Uncharacterized protein n=1 Tax=candidate division WOR-3 bacterium TaxID=2052148 RepID=A0A937XEB5_UNCW3|nr:hypothetical protein [candidate division WOR-3 bacterium]